MIAKILKIHYIKSVVHRTLKCSLILRQMECTEQAIRNSI